MVILDVLVVALICAIAALLWRERELRAALARQDSDLAARNRELIQTRDMLSIAREETQGMVNAAFDPLMVADADRRIVAINHAARDVFGVERIPLGQTVMTVTRNHELDALVGAALAGEDQPESQVSIDSAHGARTFRVRVVADRTNDRTRIILAMQDVTELLRLTRARRDMVANLSHDLRTPISNIRLLVDTLVHNFGKNPERDLKMLSKIASATDSLHHMTQELIDLSMIESGKAIMRLVETDLSDVVKHVLEELETQAEEKRLTIHSTIPTGQRVLADADQMRRVIMNIVQNAVKFTPSGGQISLTASADQGMLTVCIKDTGPGIPPQERTRIFERFYQVDSPRTGGPKANGRGTGLGLAIAKHIVEAHGGAIWAEANLPTGASILFTLPLVETSDESSPTG
jgi:two-component system phosphate regulon sensor histidine kinase PhoR